MTILNAQQIHAAVKDGGITITPFDEGQLQPATYDLRVGAQGVTTTSREVVNLKDKGLLTLEAGDFAVVTVLETIALDGQHVARFGLRSKYARQGLIATTGPQIDPGYAGRLTLGLTNLTPRPIALGYGDDLVSVEFHHLSEPSEKLYDGPFQGKTDLRVEDLQFVTETKGMAYSEVLTTLSSLSTNVAQLSTSVQAMRTTMGWLIGVVGVLVAVFGVVAAID